MILCLVFSYLLGGSLATSDSTEMSGNSDFSKSIMCTVRGGLCSAGLVDIEPATIPSECEVIIYDELTIDLESTITSNEAYIKSLVDLNKTVILVIRRSGTYEDWASILTADGNAKDAQVLCDFALKNNISGYTVENLTPRCSFTPFIEIVGQGIIPYLQQLKCSPEFIIGVVVQPLGSAIKSPCMYNFAEMNDLVTFYEIQTAFMNGCKPQLYNGLSPLSKAEHGAAYLLGMEEVAEFLKESEICLTKITYDVEVNPVDRSWDADFFTYAQVCTDQLNVSASCIQTTQNLYDKGKFVSEQDSGVAIVFIDLDDVNNDCCCCEPFAGVKSIIAGFTGSPPTPCEKFDVQSGEFMYK